MSNFLKILCTAVSLFYLSTAYPRGHYDELLDIITHLVSSNQMDLCGKADVLGNTMGETVAEISCRARKSLEKTCNIKSLYLEKLNKSLSKLQNGKECTVSEDKKEDIISFLKNLFLYFQKENFSFKAK